MNVSAGMPFPAEAQRFPGRSMTRGGGFPAFVPKGKTKVSVELIEILIRGWADVNRPGDIPGSTIVS